MESANKRMSTKTMVLGAILTALVVILQLMGAFIKFGPFSVSLVLIPIVIGAAMCGTAISAWLGLVFGFVVLLSGDATAFLVVNVPGTIITVLAKGALAGLCAGLAYKGVMALGGNKYLAVIIAAVVCPVVNTGIFILGCFMFFLETVAGWAQAAGFSGGVAHYIIFVLVGANFLFELATNIILSPVVVRLLNIKE